MTIPVIMEKVPLQLRSKLLEWENYRTIIATFITHLNSISVGMCQGYSAILLPQLMDSSITSSIDDIVNTTIIHVTPEEASWIASLGVLTNPIGALLSGILMDVCGRKATICYTTIPFLFGWIVIGLSEDLYTLCIGRCISGLAVGMSSSSYVYVAEISPTSSRGFLSAIGPVFVSFGVLMIYFLGYVTNWKMLAYICSMTAFFTMIATLFLPESPSWLATHGSLSKATEALQWLRNKDLTATDKELADILESIKISGTAKPQTINEMLRLCRRSVVWKPFLILIVFFMFQELSGIYILLYYSIDFFQKAKIFYNNHIASIIVGCLRFSSSIIGAACIQHFGRKNMATWSGLIMTISMGTAAAYEYLCIDMELDLKPYSWILMVSIMANVSGSMLGLLQLPWLMTGELFPLAVRGIMGGIVSSLAYLFIFITVKFYPILIQHLKVDSLMWMFSGASLLAAAFSIIYLPETNNKTLFEIERIFKKEKVTNNFSKEIITRSIPSVSLSIENKYI